MKSSVVRNHMTDGLNEFRCRCHLPAVDSVRGISKRPNNKGRTAAHVGPVVHRAEFIVCDCGFRNVSDILASREQACLSKLRDVGKSPQTVNHYLRTVKQFCNWLVADRRATENALAHLEAASTATDIRRERRELTTTEIAALLTATLTGPSRYGLTGEQWFLLYATALGTGLRASWPV